MLHHYEDYFEDMIGVTMPEGAAPQKITLKLNTSTWPYVKTKPLHGSQKTKEVNDDHVIIELNVIVNYELISLLFSYSENIIVLEPESLSKILIDKAKVMVNNYS